MVRMHTSWLVGQTVSLHDKIFKSENCFGSKNGLLNSEK